MEIALCPDDNYTLPAIVLIKSILYNNKTAHINILYSSLSPESIDKIKTVSPSTSFYDCKNSKFSTVPSLHGKSEHEYITASIHNRLAIPAVLKDYDKVLSLDCDMIVTGDLTPLFATNLEGFAVGVVRDINNNNIEYYNRLGYPMEDGYFNAGMMLFNIKYCLENSLMERVLEVLKTTPKGVFHTREQGALNIAFHKKCLFLSASFNVNVQGLFYDIKEYPSKIEKSLYQKMQKEGETPIVLHYGGREKPWYKEYKTLRYPLLAIWEEYEKLAGVKIKRHNYYSKRVHIKRYFTRILENLHIKHKRNITLYETKEMERRLLESVKKQ